MYQDKLKVYHCSTSNRNPITWAEGKELALKHLSKNPMGKRISEPKYDMIANTTLYRIAFLKREIPTYFYHYFSKFIGNPSMKINAEKMMKVIEMTKMRHAVFKKTVNKEWIFESYNSYELNARLSEEDQVLFQIDPINIDWKLYCQIFIYGMNKFLLKQESELPISGKKNIVRVSNTPQLRFADLYFVFNNGKDQKTRDHSQITKMVLNSEKVKVAMRAIVEEEMINSNIKESKLMRIQEKKGRDIIDRMAAKLSFTKMRVLGYVLHKAFKNMYESVVVNKHDIQMIKELNQENTGNVIYCPTHRSYVDFMILSYILYAHHIKVPHI